jgi:hypothetical protein
LSNRRSLPQTSSNKPRSKFYKFKDLIAAKKAEIEDHNSFFGQLGDYINGSKDLITDTPDWAKDELKSSAIAELASNGSTEGGLAGMGTAATVTAGYGAFFVASEIVVSNATDQHNARSTQLANLQNWDLPFARAEQDIAERNLKIADLNKQIVDAALQHLAEYTENFILQPELLDTDGWALSSYFATNSGVRNQNCMAYRESA